MSDEEALNSGNEYGGIINESDDNEYENNITTIPTKDDEDEEEDELSSNNTLNYGSYSCIIDDPKLISTMLEANNKQDFISNKFEIAKLKWQINLYPNGNKASNSGSFMVYLKLLSLPKQWREIIVCRRIYCPEIDSSGTAIVSYTKNKSNSWDQGTLKLKELKDLQPQKLIFNINIRILKIINIDGQCIFQDDQIGASINDNDNKNDQSLQRFEWKINQSLINKMQTSYPSKCFESPIFQNQWCLRYVCIYVSMYTYNYTQIRINTCFCFAFLL